MILRMDSAGLGMRCLVTVDGGRGVAKSGLRKFC
jgi:hypothetical protein